MTEHLKVLDLFSGIGGFSLGLERTGGFETVAFCEADPFCRAVLRKHWPGVTCHEDIRRIGQYPRRSVDVITGGFPCQPFSTASRGRANAQDLWPHMWHCIKTVKPRWVIAENVPGIGMAGIDRVSADLEACRYAVWPLDVDTSPPGRSRGRRRFLWLAYADGKGEPRRAQHAEVAGVSPLSGCGQDNARALGMDDGLPRRMDRLRALGNSVSPWVAEVIGRAILDVEAAA